MPTAILLGADDGVVARLSRLAVEFGLDWADSDVVASADLVVVDLAGPGALEEVARARQRWPAALIAGYLTVPDADLWTAAQRAGCDVVSNRGALGPRLRPLLAAGGRAAHAYPVLDEADLAGRLGLVARVPDTPVGPVAVYQIDGAVYATADRCPHAGALLSEGELEHRTVTCPRHGSQFDVCTGERLRGPADTEIARYDVVVSGGQVSLLLSG